MKITRTTKIMLISLFMIWIFAGISFLNYAKVDADSKDSNIYTNLQLLTDIIYKIERNYISEVDTEDLIYGAIDGMIGTLDPHTHFFTADEFRQFQESTKGEFGGLGIQISSQGDYIVVISPIEGTPAYQMGIQSGDKIIKVDGVSIKGWKIDKAIRKMKGKKGTKVTLTIIRKGVKDPLDFTITRDIIKVPPISYAFKMDNGIGYIRIDQFSASTGQELEDALNKLESQGIRGLLVDLRNNPGGLLDQAVRTVDSFLGKDRLVVSTRGRIPRANTQYFTECDDYHSGYPIIVLISKWSASASEIFAGSMQDWDRALIVGETSFGKGSVQQLFPLSNGAGIKITTAKYYIKSGRCINKDRKKGEEDLSEEEKKEHVYYTVKGRKVYGGGGITPDIKIEQRKLNKLASELRTKRVFFNYAVDYYSKHPNISKDFQVSDKLYNDFINFVKRDSIEIQNAQLDSISTWVRHQLQGQIIDKAYGREDAYKIYIKDDVQLQKALAIFDEASTLDEMFTLAKKNEE